MSKADFDPEELDFRRELEPALAQVRSTAGPCPDPDLLLAATTGVDVESAGAIRKHIALCPMCAQLSEDLAAHEPPGATAAEDRHIRARWRHLPTPVRKPSTWAWLLRPLPVASVLAAVTLAVTLAVLRTSPGSPSSSPPVTGQTPSQTTPARVVVATAFELQKPPIRVPADAVLLHRSGDETSGQYLKDLAAALEPYRRDDYAEAARSLEPLVSRYPNAAEPPFYRGVSLLFLAQNEAAIESLTTAGPRADDSLRAEISWYLALALHRAGRTAEALREVERLCKRPGAYKDRACAAAAELQQR